MKRALTRFAHGAIALVVLGALGWFAGCSDNPGSPCSLDCQTPEGVIVSNAVAPAALTAETGGALALGAADDVAYVSLAPGTVPAGSRASVRRVGDAVSVTTAVTDGGFDPVPVIAQAGDLIEVTVTDVGGAVVLQQSVLVAASRRPIIVRTDPPPRKRDVPLNASVVIVFSEPMNASTLNPSSVQLRRGTTPVAGTVSLLQGSATAAVFTPDAALDANTDYQLVVTHAVQDLDGDALDADTTVEFTTGTALAGPVASVSVLPESLDVLVGRRFQFTATARDSRGTTVTGRPITWTSDNPVAATVDPSGLVTGVGAGSASVSATVEGVSDTAAITVTSLSFVSVSAGGFRWDIAAGNGVSALTCAVTTAGAAYCWGGSFGSNLLGQSWTNSILAPVAVAGGLTFSMVITGGMATVDGISRTCGVTPDGVAYCWGSIPVAVPGGLIFSAVTVGSSHTCGLAPAGVAYCWWSNSVGQLGDGSTGSSAVPVAVTGGVRFSALSASGDHTCGLATDGVAYCWGSNNAGQLGDGSTSSSAVPVRVVVPAGVTFSALSASGEHTCGRATTGAAYCWGLNRSGQLGDGSTSSSSVPVAVAGGLTFSTLARGAAPEVPPPGGFPVHASEHTCGVITSGAAYCWGSNSYGQLGNGFTSSSTVPVAVADGLTFSALSASGVHTCGLTTDGVAYCWGDNRAGQLGNGTTSSSSVPVKVMGQP